MGTLYICTCHVLSTNKSGITVVVLFVESSDILTGGRQTKKTKGTDESMWTKSQQLSKNKIAERVLSEQQLILQLHIAST